MTGKRIFEKCVCAALVLVPVLQADSQAVPRSPQRRAEVLALEPGPAVARRATMRPSSAPSVGGGVFENTGADACFDAQIIPVPIGPPGSPITTTITGDNTGATGPDCQVTGTHPTWWEAFELTECAIVRIDLCGTTPEQEPSNGFLTLTCPLSGTNCGNPRFRNSQGQGAPYCADDNNWFIFENLDPGIYYYPVYSDPAELINGQGPYQIQISAEACPGACCDLDTGTCTDNVAPLDCAEPQQVFNPGDVCCQAECLPDGATYASRGVEMLSQVPLNSFGGGIQNANDVWGYTSPSGREYAIVGLSPGTGFVEITDPFNPVVIANMPDAVSLWSDMRTYQQYAFNSNESGGGVQIFDLSDIDNGTVTEVGAFTDSGLQTVHNLSLNVDSGYLYLCASNLASGTLIAVDLSDPEAPTFAGIWIEGANQGIYVHDAQVITYSSGPYIGQEIAFAFGGDGLYIVDVTDKGNMHTRGTVLNQGFSFGHQGWFTQDLRYILMGDEGGSFLQTTYVINIEDLDAPFLVTSFSTGLCTIDHNQMIRGSLSYQADYNSGLRIFDISDPVNAEQVAYFDTHPENNNFEFAGAWGVFTQFPSGLVAISDMQRGLFVFNYDCNDNGVDDTDDIDLGTSDDSNGNGIPDECECQAMVAAAPEPGGTDKNRFLSIIPNNGNRPMALRIKFMDLPDFPSLNGQVRWAGPPQLYPNVAGQSPFWGAQLQCDPFVADWGDTDLLHIFGAGVVPGSTYEIQLIHEACVDEPTDEANYSAPMTVTTIAWGDIVEPFGGPNQPGFGDVTALVAAFQGAAGAPSKPRAQIQPSEPDPTLNISFADITVDVAAFQGAGYPFAGPGTCP